MKRKNVRRDQSSCFITWITVDAIERGLEALLSQELEICEELLDSYAPSWADLERD
jgi:hypothetical protein